MEALHKIRRGIDVALSSACAVIFAAMVVIGTYQIVTRFVFRSPSTVSEELLTYSFTWMALLSSAYVFGKRDHMRMGFMADKAGPAEDTQHPGRNPESVSGCHRADLWRNYNYSAYDDAVHGIPWHSNGCCLHHYPCVRRPDLHLCSFKYYQPVHGSTAGCTEPGIRLT